MASIALQATRRSTRVSSQRLGLGALKAALWVALAVVMLFPTYWGLITSFKPPHELNTDPPIFWPQQWSIVENYSFVLTQIPIARYYLNSFYVAAVSTLAVLFTSSLAGYIFEEIDLKGKEYLFMGIIATMMVPFPVRMIPLYIIFRDLHLVNTLAGLYLGALTSAYGIFLMRQFMKTVPRELLDAARIDGAGEFSIFARIAMPLCTAPLAALGIFHFMYEWDQFVWPLLMIDDGDLRTLPLGLVAFRTGFGVQDWHKIMAGAMMGMIPVIIVYLLGQRHFVRGITLTGLKS
ncbi:MAG: carbohydrate ABC transporter permease [Chloroflexi bacterium]|nr:carbohydrate ABC transporter permease [Chloroflexota bacterium]